MPNNDYILRSDALKVARYYKNGREENHVPSIDDVRLTEYQLLAQAINSIPAADVEPKRNWISVTERKPFAEYGESDAVLTVDSLGEMRVAYWDGGNWVLTNGNFIESTVKFPIIYWMPLPEPPKEEFKNGNK